MFGELVSHLGAARLPGHGRACLIGNFFCDGSEIDAMFVSQNCICVIEFKDYRGLIHFSENDAWFADDVEVKGGNQRNPFSQVRANKFALLERLRAAEEKVLGASDVANWGHISGFVLFGKDITFDEPLPGTIAPWFLIGDMSDAADRLTSRRSHRISLGASAIGRLLEILEIGPRHRFPLREKLVEIGPEHAGEDRANGPLEVTYHRAFDIGQRLEELASRGGPNQRARDLVQGLVVSAARGNDPFSQLRWTGDGRVEHSRVYELTPDLRLVTIWDGRRVYLCTVGDAGQVDGWLEANAGLTLVLDSESKRIVPTIAGRPADVPLQAAVPVMESTALLRDLPELDLDGLVHNRVLREALLGLDRNADGEKIDETLALVQDADCRSFLRDILGLLRNGDVEGARARIALRNGTACPVADAPGLVTAALDSGSNSDQTWIIDESTSDEQVARLLQPRGRFLDWVLFPHPDQKRLVEAEFDRPAIVTGVSGSGKTCVLMHRACHLARRYPGDRIGVLTLNRNLAGLLEHLKQQLCPDGDGHNIHVMAFYDYFSDLLHAVGARPYLDQLSGLLEEGSPMRDVLAAVDPSGLAREFDEFSGETLEDTWECYFETQNDAMREQLLPVVQELEQCRVDASRYLREEFTLIRSAFVPPERREGYIKMLREGRGIRFEAPLREEILRCLLHYEEFMLAGGLLDVLGLTHAVTAVWKKLRDLPGEMRFRCLLIDEYQDLSTLDLRLFNHVVDRSLPDSLFLAGDSVQRVMVKSLKLGAAFTGEAVRRVQIRKNFRNSRQILRAASLLANKYGDIGRTQGEEIELIDPELAVRETCKPFAERCGDQISRAWQLADSFLADPDAHNVPVCIATASPEMVEVGAIKSRCPGLLAPADPTGEYLSRPKEVVVATMSEIKGFEFAVVIIVGCSAAQLPAKGTHPDEAWREALRFYVAMTRARNQLYLLHEGEPSVFLETMREELNWVPASETADESLGHGGGIARGADSFGDNVRRIAAKRQPDDREGSAPANGLEVVLPVTVKKLAALLDAKSYQIIHDLMGMNVFASLTQALDPEVARKVVAMRGYTLRVVGNADGDA